MVNDVSNQQLEEIVKELDECPKSSNAEKHSQEQQAQVEANTTRQPKPCKKSCGCAIDDFCFRCVLSKVFTLEPFLNPADDDIEATAIEQPGQITGAAGAGHSVNCTFKNTGETAWPKNV